MRNASSIILLNRENKILMLLRDNKLDINYPNYWSLLGGRIEENESPLEAIRREIDEEISCKVYNISEIGIFSDLPIAEKIFVFKGEIYEELENIILYEGQKLWFFDFWELKNIKIVNSVRKFIFKNKELIFNQFK